jgi:hypothetical protein
MTPEEDRLCDAYLAALSLIGDQGSQRKLKALLDILECRDLLRKRRQEALERMHIVPAADPGDQGNPGE